MASNFIACDRDQPFLMPPSLLDWVPETHLVWTILGAVEEMDLGAFYGAYRADGRGRPAYEPAMMVALLLYAYARGNRSSRGLERQRAQRTGALDGDDEAVAEERVEVELEFDQQAIVARQNGRDGWLVNARHQVNEQREQEAQPVPRSRPQRLLESERRMQENL